MGPDGTILEAWEYDTAGNITVHYEGNPEETPGIHYVYDLAGRKIQAVTPEGHDQSFVYDAVGNLVNATDGEGNTTWFENDAWEESWRKKQVEESCCVMPMTRTEGKYRGKMPVAGKLPKLYLSTNNKRLRIPTFTSRNMYSLQSSEVLEGISKGDMFCEIITNAQKAGV